MLEWLSPISFLLTVLRVLLVWCAFYSAGYFLEKPLKIKSLFPLLPRELTGILFFLVFAVLLSLLGLLNRTVAPAIVILFSLPGLLMVVKKLTVKMSRTAFSISLLISSILFILVCILNLTYASMPNLLFDDPLITYAVQPDRWLNAGGIYWLAETSFSGFPLTYEIMSVWPASLSFDRLDQLSVLQVFQMSMLMIAIFRGLSILKIKSELKLPFAVIALFCSMLYFWCSLAKTDTAAVLFCTLALSSAVRELSDRSLKPYTSWLLMGMALATKQTSFLVLAAFLPYGIWRMLKTHWKTWLTALLCLTALPGVFAFRTMIVTGSPTYPVHQVPFMVKDEWRSITPPAEMFEMNDRGSDLNSANNYSLAKHIGIFLTSAEGLFLLFLSGLIAALCRKPKTALVFLPLVLYFAVAVKAFWPPWWGAKYSILVYPFMGLLGLKFLQEYKRVSSVSVHAILLVSMIVPGFIITASTGMPAKYRYTVAKSVLAGNWDESLGYRLNYSTSEGMTHMWLNSYLDEPATILSLLEEKRYFCDHTIYVGPRHPATQYLYLDNSLEQECRILDSLEVDFVTFYRLDPVFSTMENRLSILDHVGRDDILEPVLIVSNNFMICKYNSPDSAL